MLRAVLLSLLSFTALSACSSVGVYDLQKQGRTVRQAPAQILVQPFAAKPSAFHLGRRSEEELHRLRGEIIADLARGTAGELRTYAANSAVLTSQAQLRPGTWLLRGEILKVHQGSRALRAAVGLGAGRTAMRTRVSVLRVTTGGLEPLLTFRTTGSSGLEPGVAPGIATGGVSLIGTSAAAVGGSLPGVSSDIDRTAHEIAAVLSAYLQRNGLQDPSRRAITPNMRGELPTTVNATRAIPAPLRGSE